MEECDAGEGMEECDAGEEEEGLVGCFASKPHSRKTMMQEEDDEGADGTSVGQ